MLTQSQKNRLKDVRTIFRTIPCTLWTVTKSGVTNTDFYRRPTTTTSGARIFTGAVAWSNTIYRADSTGGFYKTSQVAIVCSYDEKSFLDTQNSYLVCEGVPLKMKSLVQATDTNELVIYCDRLNE